MHIGRNIKSTVGMMLSIAVLLGICSSCAAIEAKKSIGIEEAVQIIQAETNQEKVQIFRCTNCGELTTICVCHEEIGYPSDFCCQCAEKNFRICTICGVAKANEECQKIDDYYFCEECMSTHSSAENPAYIDGEPFYFSVVDS